MDDYSFKKQVSNCIANETQFYLPSSSNNAAWQDNICLKDFVPVVSSMPEALLMDRMTLMDCNNYGSSFGNSNESMPSRPRRRLRTIFSNKQIEILERAYVKSKYPDACVKREISREAKLPIERVQVWFQNKRTRDKKSKEERNCKSNEESENLSQEAIPKSQSSSACRSDFTPGEERSWLKEEEYSKYDPLDIQTANKSTPDTATTQEYLATSQRKAPSAEKGEFKSPLSTIERSCQQYLQCLGTSNMTKISPSFVRYLHQQLRMSPPDSVELLAFQNHQQEQQQHLQDSPRTYSINLISPVHGESIRLDMQASI